MQIEKLAAYLEEAGDDVASCCDTLISHNIRYVALRNISNNNICKVNDKICQNIRSVTKSSGVSIVMINSDLGNVPSSELMRIPKAEIDRTFHIVDYFRVPFVTINVGIHTNNSENVISEWMSMITERAISFNITPLLEIAYGSALYKPSDAYDMMKRFKRWKLLYDPAQLIIKQSQDPFVRYYELLKNYIGAIDIHDFKIGKGHKPAGFGDAKIEATLKDSINTFKGWYFLEPSLGRKFGSALTKQETFKFAVEALEAI
jgi:hypothetical protein